MTQLHNELATNRTKTFPVFFFGFLFICFYAFLVSSPEFYAFRWWTPGLFVHFCFLFPNQAQKIRNKIFKCFSFNWKSFFLHFYHVKIVFDLFLLVFVSIHNFKLLWCPPKCIMQTRKKEFLQVSASRCCCRHCRSHKSCNFPRDKKEKFLCF